MGDFLMFLLGFIPALAFAVHSYADYRAAKGKPAGKAFKFFYKALAVLVVLEIIVLVFIFFIKK